MNLEEYNKWKDKMAKLLQELSKEIKVPGTSGQKKKKRPYSPPNGSDDIAICGVGDKTQLDISDAKQLVLLKIPKTKHYPPELKKISQEINSILNVAGKKALLKKKRQYMDSSLTLTLVIDDPESDMYLSYAKPIESFLSKK